MKTGAFVVLRVIVLTIILFICFGVAAGVVGIAGNSQTSGQPAAGALPLLTVCFLETAVLTYLILRSRWTGWRLTATVFFVFYGVTTFMSQIESAVFLTRQASWDPFAFIDLCATQAGGAGRELLCRHIQQREWELLFHYCYQEAAGLGAGTS